MPNAKRRPDGEIHQEWLEDTSNEGNRSGDLALEVAFDDDNEDGQWYTHLLRPDEAGQYPGRLSRGDRTSIMIKGLSNDRQRQITELIHKPFRGEGIVVANDVTTRRAKILQALTEDPNLQWAA